MTKLIQATKVDGSIKNLLKLSKNEDLNKKYRAGFPERLRKREAEFASQAKRQAINARFLNREYTI